MAVQAPMNPLTKRITLSPSYPPHSPLLPLLSSSPPDLLLQPGVGAAPLLLHSSLAFSYFPSLGPLLQHHPPWAAGAQALLYIDTPAPDLLGRLLASLYDPSQPLVYSSKEAGDLASLLASLGTPEHLYTIGEQV